MSHFVGLDLGQSAEHTVLPQIRETHVPSTLSISLCPENADGQQSHSDSVSRAHDYEAVVFNQQSALCSYPVHRSLPPTRRSSSDENLLPGEA